MSENNLEVPVCAPLRRQSASAPAILLLDGVLRKAESLHEQLDHLTDQVKERSSSMVNVPDLSSTPLTSRRSPVSMVCHGCHGIIGNGAHVGSQTGKNLCTREHSPTCPGGIFNDNSWKACPVGYIPGMRMSETGFEQTMDTVDFNPGNFFSSSTPSVGQTAQTSENDLLRFHRQAQGEGVRERRPGMVYASSGDDYDATSENVPQSLPSDVEEQVRHLRARNQEASAAGSAGGGDVQLTIAEVRRMPGMKDVVGDQMDRFKDIIPALGSAPSATVTPAVGTGFSIQNNVEINEVSAAAPLSAEQQQLLAQSEAEYSELLAQQIEVQHLSRVAHQPASTNQQRSSPSSFAVSQRDTPSASAEFNELLKEQQQMSEAIKAAQAAQTYLLGQNISPAQSIQHPTQTAADIQLGVQQLGSSSVTHSGDGQADLQSELLLQKREQQRLQEALELQRKQYSALLAQQQQQAALLAAQKKQLEQEQFATKLRDQREKNARVAAELDAARNALKSLQMSKASVPHPQMQRQQQFSTVNTPSQSGINTRPARAQSNSVPTLCSPVAGDASFTPEYDFFKRPDGSIYRVMRQPTPQRSVDMFSAMGQQQLPQPATQLPVLPTPAVSFLEWRISQTGVPYQVLVQPAPLQQPASQSRHAPNLSGQTLLPPDQTFLQPQPYRSPQLPRASGQLGVDTSHLGRDSSMAQQLQDKVQGIVSLVESGGEVKKLKLLDQVRSCL